MIDLKKRDRVVGVMMAMEAPKLSIYLPTHRSFPENKQDPILYKNLVQQAEAELDGKYPRRLWEGTIAALNRLLDDTELWMHTSEGLGVLAAGDRVESFDLERPAGPMVQIGGHFHLLPLYPLVDSMGQAYLMDISLDRFRSFHVNRDGLAEISLPEIKGSFTELFDDSDAQRHMNTGSAAGESGGYHGYQHKDAQMSRDTTKYFRYLDDAFTKLYRRDGLPVILAGTEASQAEFRKLAKGTFYLAGGISQPLESLSFKAALELVNKILAPTLEKSMGSLRTQISNKRSEKKALSDLKEIAAAAAEGRVESLLVTNAAGSDSLRELEEPVEQVLLYGGQLSLDSDGLLGLNEPQLALLR